MTSDAGSPVTRSVARALVGPGLVVAAALLVKGYADVGDGFAAGMVVGLTVALLYVAFGARGAEELLPVLRWAPALMVGGLLLALAAGSFPVLVGEPLVSHRPGPGEEVRTIGALELFTPFLLDLGICLLVVGVLTTVLHQFAGASDSSDRGAP